MFRALHMLALSSKRVAEGLGLGNLFRTGTKQGSSDLRRDGPSAGSHSERNASDSGATASYGKGRLASTRRRTRLLIMVTLLAAAGMTYFALDSKMPASSQLSRIPPMDPTPGGLRQQESERYRETLTSANESNSNQAGRLGESYISVPEGILEQVSPPGGSSRFPWLPASTEEKSLGQANGAKIDDRAAPVSSSAESANSNSLSTGARAAADENPYKSAMLAQMTAISRAMLVHPPESAIYSVELPEKKERERRVSAIASRRAVSEVDARVPERGWTLPAGTILYAEMVNSVSSDHASPIVARVNSGRFQGAYLTGRFTAPQGVDGLIVEFDSFSMPDGKTVPVDAVAIDGINAEAFVASSIDRRILSRYIPALAASFVAGFADSVSTTAQAVTGVDGTALIAAEEPSHKESLHAGLRDAAKLAASDIAASAPRGPRINLVSGHPIGILFLKTATDEQVTMRREQ